MNEAHGDRVDGPRQVNAGVLMAFSEGIVPLVVSIMRTKHVSAAEMSRRTSLSKTIIGRSLSGRRKVGSGELQKMIDALEIDLTRAMLALHFGDWRLYFDEDITVVAGLVCEVHQTLPEARNEYPRANIGQSGIRVLAKLLTDAVARHDAETYRRQQEKPLYGC